jgi:phenylalanyl-tRNA synthetase beta chain
VRARDTEAVFVEVANPIASDMAVMRTSLWAGLINSLKHNLSRQQNRAKLFEAGLRFRDTGASIEQTPMIAGLIYGERDAESWTQTKGKVDFFDLKGHVEALIAVTGAEAEFSFSVAEHSALHPGQSAAISRSGKPVGYLGRLHPSVQKQLDLDQPAFLFECEVGSLLEGSVPASHAISRFPGVRRDIAILVDRSVQASAILEAIRAEAGPLLSELKIFDVYEGKGIENNNKSIAMGLTYQEQSRTLNETEVNASVEAVVNRLKTDFDATLRG